MQLLTLPCLEDNYAYLVTCPETGETAVVDPSDGPRVAVEIKRLGLHLVAILATHHHWDHTGGIATLVAQFPGLVVYGSRYDQEHARIPHQTRGLSEGELFAIGSLRFSVIEIPGHTLGAIAYVGEERVFTGDTLFLGGCGRIFEGTHAMMQHSLAKLRALPDETMIYCGHEYTQKNLEFALTIEPDSIVLKERYAIACDLRAKGLPTVPSSIKEERASNPFLRWDDSVLRDALEKKIRRPLADTLQVFSVLRDLKDHF